MDLVSGLSRDYKPMLTKGKVTAKESKCEGRESVWRVKVFHQYLLYYRPRKRAEIQIICNVEEDAGRSDK